MDPEHGWQREQIEAAIERIRNLAFEFDHETNSHTRSAARWGALHTILGVPAAVLAALAGASALADLFGATVSGVIAFTAAALSALIAYVGATDEQRKNEVMAEGRKRFLEVFAAIYGDEA